jgi:hypothetical protein
MPNETMPLESESDSAEESPFDEMKMMPPNKQSPETAAPSVSPVVPVAQFGGSRRKKNKNKNKNKKQSHRKKLKSKK